MKQLTTVVGAVIQSLVVRKVYWPDGKQILDLYCIWRASVIA